MKKLIVLLILGVAAWSGYRHFTASSASAATPMTANASSAHPAAPVAQQAPTPTYTCDGRTHCSQMRSCDEATYFIRHCPNTKMDGNGDGVPCEQQWCG